MRSLLAIFIIFLVGHGYTHAQGVPGIVTDSDSPLSGAMVKNIKSKQSAVTDANGNFRITAAKGDTLITSFIGYKADTLVYSSYIFLNINLHRLPQALHEVTINSKGLSPSEKFKQNQADYKQIYRIGDDKHMLSTSGGLGSIGAALSIDAIYSALSTEGKNARKLQKVLVRDYHEDIVSSRFTKKLVAENTGLKDNELNDFMINNRPTYEFILRASDYDLISFIQRRAKGIILLSDDPVAESKSNSKGLNIKFKSPDIQPSNAAPGSDTMPKTPPF